MCKEFDPAWVLKSKDEIWKPIKGFEGYYEVSNMGRVRSLNRVVVRTNGKAHTVKGKILALYKNHKGYLAIGLYKNAEVTMKLVHRLVAEAFIPNHLNMPQINHKNEIKTDNRVENLEWCDNKYNMNYGTRAERALITIGMKPFICLETNKVYLNKSECERDLNLRHENICKVLNGKRKHTGGYHFKYLEGGDVNV